MQSWLNQIIHGRLFLYWAQWHAVVESEKRAGAIMSASLARIFQSAVLGGFNSWVEMVWSRADEESKQEMEDLLDRLKREKQERAAMTMRRCLNKISNAAFVQSWEKWRSVIAAMNKAGKVCDDCGCVCCVDVRIDW